MDATPLTLWKAAIRFQSLFWWRGHLDFGETMIRAQAMKFQSLFWWRGHLDGAMLQRPCPTHKVSILVLVERPFGQAARDSPEAINIRFQSLFWWRGHLDGAMLQRPCPTHKVSILVLVERPFGPGIWAVDQDSQDSFNPCFGGEAIWTQTPDDPTRWNMKFQSLFWWRGHLDAGIVAYLVQDQVGFNPCFGGEAIWTTDGVNHRLQVVQVSILVLVERPFGLAFILFLLASQVFQSLFWWRGHLDPPPILYGSQGFRFQSLFWWRGHLDRRPAQQPAKAAQVSILVLVERPFGQAIGDEYEMQGVPFQSLFWWRGHLDVKRRHVPQERRMFQSLFWWRGHLDHSVDAGTKADAEFQSLFWWRGHLDSDAGGVAGGFPGFNPCFGGEAIWTNVPYRRGSHHLVSILVLVERPFGQMPSTSA